MTTARSFWPGDALPPYSEWRDPDGRLICYMRLRPEVKTIWLGAMRGGHYIQGVNYLCRANNPHPTVTQAVPEGTRCWCCLGIRCDLAHRLGKLPEPTEATAPGGVRTYRWEPSSYAVPGPVELAWAYGVTDDGTADNAYQLARATDEHLAYLNDGAYVERDGEEMLSGAMTLNEIAGWIEENL